MLIVLLATAGLIASQLVIGLAVASALGIEESCEPPDLALIGLWSMVVPTAYLSLFLPIDVRLLGLLVLMALVAAPTQRRVNPSRLVDFIRSNWSWWWLPALALLAFAPRLAGRPFSFDSGYYHAQAVLWVRDVGLAPGTANLIPQLGFDSSWWILGALLETPEGPLTSWHFVGMATFLPLLSVAGNGLVRLFVDRDPRPRFIYAGLLPLGAAEAKLLLPSYSPDPAVAQLLLLLGYWFLRLLETEALERSRVALVALLGVSLLVSLKLSSLVALGLLPVIAWVCFRGSRAALFKATLVAAAAIGLTVVPFLIRTWVISGWVLFPAAWSMGSPPDWQLADQNREIIWECVRCHALDPTITCGRCPEWTTDWPLGGFRLWWSTFSRERLLAGTLLLLPVVAALWLVHPRRRREEWTSSAPFALFLLLGLGYWFTLAPAPRFGLGWILGATFFFATPWIRSTLSALPRLGSRLLICLVIAASCVLFLRGLGLRQMMQNGFPPLLAVQPLPEVALPSRTCKASGIPIKVGFDASWDTPLPVWLPSHAFGQSAEALAVCQRGDDLEQGFEPFTE